MNLKTATTKFLLSLGVYQRVGVYQIIFGSSIKSHIIKLHVFRRAWNIGIKMAQSNTTKKLDNWFKKRDGA